MGRIAALKPGDGAFDQTAAQVLEAKFAAAMDNDLNTSLAVTSLYDVLKYKTSDETKLRLLEKFDTVLDLDLLAAADKSGRRCRNRRQQPPRRADWR